MSKGTITWYEIAKGELPEGTDNFQDRYLIKLHTGYVCEANYISHQGDWIYSGGYCKPTHWAHINLPE